MIKDKSFEAYWEEHEIKLTEAGFRKWLITTMRQAAKMAWDAARDYEHQQILESNVIINKGIWKAITDQNKKSEQDNDYVQDSFKD